MSNQVKKDASIKQARNVAKLVAAQAKMGIEIRELEEALKAELEKIEPSRQDYIAKRRALAALLDTPEWGHEDDGTHVERVSSEAVVALYTFESAMETARGIESELKQLREKRNTHRKQLGAESVKLLERLPDIEQKPEGAAA